MNKDKEFNYNKWIDSITNNFGKEMGKWADKEIKKNCNPFLFWLLVKTKNKYLIKLVGFEIRQDIPSLNNNFSRHTELWKHGKFLSEFNYKLI